MFCFSFFIFFFLLPFNHLESCCSVLIGWWSPRVRKIAKSLPMKSADVPEYSSPSASEESTVRNNFQSWIQCVLPGTNHGRQQTHRSEGRLRAFWGHRGFSLDRFRNVKQVERCYPVVERVRVQNEASKSHTRAGKRYIYSLCFKLHQILMIADRICDTQNFRPHMSNFFFSFFNTDDLLCFGSAIMTNKSVNTTLNSCRIF